MIKFSNRIVTRKIITQNIVIEIISSLLIILFIYTGLNKMMDYNNFKLQLGRSPFIQPFAAIIAASLPLGELLIAAALVIKRSRLAGLYASFFMMTLFTCYIWVMLHYAYDLPCSCGGVLAQMTWKDHLLFNVLFTLAAFTGVVLQSRARQNSFKHNKLIIPSLNAG